MYAYVPRRMRAARIMVRVVDNAAARIVDVLAAEFDVVAGLQRNGAGDIDIVFGFHGEPVPACAA